MEVSGQLHAPAALPPGRFCKHQSWSRHCRGENNILPLLVIEPRQSNPQSIPILTKLSRLLVVVVVVVVTHSISWWRRNALLNYRVLYTKTEGLTSDFRNVAVFVPVKLYNNFIQHFVACFWSGSMLNFTKYLQWVTNGTKLKISYIL
jgi:hypothetical protein